MSVEVIILYVLYALLCTSVFVLTRVKDLFTVVVVLGIFSGLMATIFTMLGAADVGFTEAVVGAGASTAFFMALMRKVDPTKVSHHPKGRHMIAIVLSLVVGGFLLFGVWHLPAFGDPNSPAATHVAQDFLNSAYPDMKTPNVVTAVLGDYRSLDTMVEAAVVLTAVLSCLLVLGKKFKREDEDE